jgi:hypothetical protein
LVLQLVFALVIFLSGTVIGVGGTMQWFKHRKTLRGPRVRPPDANEMVAQWTQEYGLTSEQGEPIKLALVQADQARRAAFREAREKMDAALKDMVAGIKAAMTPEQFEKWDEEFQKRMRRFRGPGGRGGHRRGGRRGFRDPNDPNRPRPQEMVPPPPPPPD